ncbi:MAG: LysR family transcriptional regulator [Caulobacteraceae bacterium]
MRFKGLDLNLLVALDALVDTRSVSAAARRLHLSQPAMSAALSRLRDYFGDQLFVVSGKRMYPTAFAEALSPQLKECLRGLDSLVSSPNVFDPATAQRTFVIVASDYVTTAVIVPLVARLAERAPGVKLDIVLPNEDSIAQVAEGKVDLLITPDAYVHPDHPAELLFEERHLVVGWSGNPIFKRGLTEDDIFESGHVAVAIGRDRVPAFADRQLALMGRQRRIEVTAAGFTVVPWLLRNTMRLALMHERLAKVIAADFPMVYAPIPFEFPLMRQLVQHHQAKSTDQGLRWLRAQLAAVV